MSERNKRAVCTSCHYPESHCLCIHVKHITNKTKLIILQHPSEVKNAKNTARLAKLCFSQCELHIGESEHDFNHLRNLPVGTTCVLYPSEQSISLDTNHELNEITHLILIDGTWKKAHKILMLNPWLQTHRFVSFTSVPTNQYTIRKAPRADSLSTIEAIAHSISLIEQCDVTPAYDLLKQMMELQYKHMPEHVRQRY